MFFVLYLCNVFIHTACDRRKQSNKEKKDVDQLDELKADEGTRGFGGPVAEPKHSLPETEVARSTDPQVQHEVVTPRTIISKARPTLERPPERTQTSGKSPVFFASNNKIFSTVPQTLTKLPVSPSTQENTSSTALVAPTSTETDPMSPLSHKKDSAAVDGGHDLRETKEVLSDRHKKLEELAEHRAKSPPSE